MSRVFGARIASATTEMLDPDIRRQLHRSVLAKYKADPETIVVDEFWVGSNARVDLAVVNGEMCGYEIKSPSDNLSRLPAQTREYGLVFDRMTLVVGECHFRTALRAVPPWWGVIVVQSEQRTCIEEYRASQPNPKVSADALVQLLWRDEALSLLESSGHDYGVRSKAKKYVWERLADLMPLDALKSAVRAALRARQNWRVDPS